METFRQRAITTGSPQAMPIAQRTAFPIALSGSKRTCVAIRRYCYSQALLNPCFSPARYGFSSEKGV